MNMKIYIYKLKQENLIEISKDLIRTSSIEEDDCDNNYEFLFCIGDGDLEKILNDLREYKCLFREGLIFKNTEDIYQYFSDKIYLMETELQEAISESEGESLIINFKRVAKNLNDHKILSLPDCKENPYFHNTTPKIEYRVDVYNYLSDIFGDDIVRKVLEFMELSKTTQDLILSVNNLPTKDKKLKHLNEKVDVMGSEIDSALQFLPEWYRLEYKISGQSNELEVREKNIRIEFSNTSTLGKNTLQVQKELYSNLRACIFQSFDIGKTYSGSYILSKLREIYKSLGIEKTAKIRDIYEFFDYKKVNLRYHISEYKLVTRKIS